MSYLVVDSMISGKTLGETLEKLSEVKAKIILKELFGVGDNKVLLFSLLFDYMDEKSEDDLIDLMKDLFAIIYEKTEEGALELLDDLDQFVEDENEKNYDDHTFDLSWD